MMAQDRAGRRGAHARRNARFSTGGSTRQDTARMATPSANGYYERSLPQAESIGVGQLGKGNLYGAEVDMRFRTQALDRVFTRDTVPKDAWIEIDLDAIAHNVRITRARIGANRQIAAVVKADAYGHGAIPGAGITRPGRMLLIMGTSTCHMTLSDRDLLIPGICGTVEDGMMTYERDTLTDETGFTTKKSSTRILTIPRGKK